jgi:hypothetical protein
MVPCSPVCAIPDVGSLFDALALISLRVRSSGFIGLMMSLVCGDRNTPLAPRHVVSLASDMTVI